MTFRMIRANHIVRKEQKVVYLKKRSYIRLNNERKEISSDVKFRSFRRFLVFLPNESAATSWKRRSVIQSRPLCNDISTDVHEEMTKMALLSLCIATSSKLASRQLRVRKFVPCRTTEIAGLVKRNSFWRTPMKITESDKCDRLIEIFRSQLKSILRSIYYSYNLRFS